MFSVPTWILLGRTVWNKMMSTWKCHSLIWKSSMVPRKLGGATASHLHFNFSFVLCCLIWVVAREYIEDIKNSQKGRPHPDKKASNLDLWWQLLSISKAEATNTYSLQTNCKKCLGLKVCMIRDLSIVIVTSPAWQFKSNPQYRIYKVFKHTARKSASGLPPAPFHFV